MSALYCSLRSARYAKVCFRRLGIWGVWCMCNRRKLFSVAFPAQEMHGEKYRQTFEWKQTEIFLVGQAVLQMSHFQQLVCVMSY